MAGTAAPASRQEAAAAMELVEVVINAAGEVRRIVAGAFRKPQIPGLVSQVQY